MDAKVMQIFICHKFAKTFSRTIYPFFTTVYYFPSLSKRYLQRPCRIRILWAKLLLCSTVVLPFSLTFSLLPVAQTTLLNTGWYVVRMYYSTQFLLASQQCTLPSTIGTALLRKATDELGAQNSPCPLTNTNLQRPQQRRISAFKIY